MSRPAEYVCAAEDFVTGEPLEIARLTYRDQVGCECVLLAARPPGGAWEATWLGPLGNSLRAPIGLLLAGELLERIEAAPQITAEAFDL